MWAVRRRKPAMLENIWDAACPQEKHATITKWRCSLTGANPRRRRLPQGGGREAGLKLVPSLMLDAPPPFARVREQGDKV